MGTIQTLSILGSTGSIGVCVLNVVRRYPERFRVAVLCGHRNTALLASQAKEFKPEIVVITDEKAYIESKHLFENQRVIYGSKALITAVSYPVVDTVVAAMVGAQGFIGVYEAVRLGKKVCIANKEALVCGGKLIMESARNTGAKILPVDSEHSAVFQVLQGHKEFRRIILTASGGAFYGRSKKELEFITPEMATCHPNWSMGKKITVDSSTMMNKGLEIIEARWLFNTFEIDYIIHPQSVIHSMVEFTDGSILSQMSHPDMEYPIQYALVYPDRLPTSRGYYPFDQPLSFKAPDEEVFILPKLAKASLTAHEGAPLVLNAANEAAVQLFLNKRIGFTHIFDIVREAMETADFPKIDSPQAVIEAHNEYFSRVIRNYEG